MTLQKIDSITETKVAAGHVAANTIRLLIAGSLAGSLIGMSGQNIEKFRNSCGATITVLAQNQLPLCASAHESDRVVQISGDVRAVLKALEEIGSQLRFMVGKVNKNIDKFNLAVLLNRWLWLNRGLTSTYNSQWIQQASAQQQALQR